MSTLVTTAPRLDPEARERLDALHDLLLRLAGRLPDQLIVQARQWLADRMPVEVARAVVFGAVAGRVPISGPDAGLLADLLAEAGEETDAVDEIPRGLPTQPPHYRLAPVSPLVLAEHGDAVPYRPDLTGRYDGPGGPDEVDLVLTGALRAGLDGVRALWRVWRFPARETRWPPPRRMYLAQVTGDGHPVIVAAALQGVLRGHGEVDPRFETFREPGDLPDHQRAALASAALLWSVEPARPIRFAHPVLPTPGPVGDAERFDADDRDRVSGYLDAGVPLVISTGREVDGLDPDRGSVVPTDVRTDGTWIWSDGLSYHLREHGLPPEADLLAHIRAQGHTPPEVDAVALHRALGVLDGFVAVRRSSVRRSSVRRS